VVFIGLDLLPALHPWAVHASGRFMSLVFTSYDLAGEYLVLALAAGLYFGRTRGRSWYLVTALLGIPIVVTFQRSALLGAVATLLSFVWLAQRYRGRLTYLILGVGLAVCVAGGGLVHPMMRMASAALGRDIRPDYWSADTLEVRLGFWARAIDLGRFTFPLGVGPGMARYALRFPVPEVERNFSATAWAAYSSMATGQRTTSSHNTFLEFVLENGALGALVLGALAAVLVGSFRRWRHALRRRGATTVPLSTLQAAVYAALVGLALNASLEPSGLPYSIMLLLVYLAVMCRGLEEAAARAACAPVAVVAPEWLPRDVAAVG
jgi:O-antigen ligase